MDQAARASGPAVGEGKRGPQEIREDIEQTREELGETVEALAAKTDVAGQAKAKVADTKQRARATVDTVKSRIGGAKVGGLPAAARERAKPIAQRLGGETTPAGSRDIKREVTRRLRSRPDFFRLVAAFAAGVLVGSADRG